MLVTFSKPDHAADDDDQFQTHRCNSTSDEERRDGGAHCSGPGQRVIAFLIGVDGRSFSVHLGYRDTRWRDVITSSAPVQITI